MYGNYVKFYRKTINLFIHNRIWLTGFTSVLVFLILFQQVELIITIMSLNSFLEKKMFITLWYLDPVICFRITYWAPVLCKMFTCFCFCVKCSSEDPHNFKAVYWWRCVFFNFQSGSFGYSNTETWLIWSNESVIEEYRIIIIGIRQKAIRYRALASCFHQNSLTCKHTTPP